MANQLKKQTTRSTGNRRMRWRSAAGLLPVTALLVAVPAGAEATSEPAHPSSTGHASLGIKTPPAKVSTSPTHAGKRSAPPAIRLADSTTACPASTFPVNGQGNYAVAFSATLSNVTIHGGYDEDPNPAFGPGTPSFQGWGTIVTGITGQACGLVEVPGFTAVVQPSNLVVDASHAQIVLAVGGIPTTLVGIALQLTPVGLLTATITHVRPDGTLDATGQGTMNAVITAPNPPTLCSTTLAAGVTTGQSTVVPPGRGTPTNVADPWTVVGQPVHGPLLSAHATVVGNNFGVPNFPMQLPPTYPDGCNVGYSFNRDLAGVDAAGNPYYPGIQGKPPHSVYPTLPTPAGAVQVSADLTLTSLDLAVGRPVDTAMIARSRKCPRLGTAGVAVVAVAAALGACDTAPSSLPKPTPAHRSEPGGPYRQFSLLAHAAALPFTLPPDCVPHVGVPYQLGAVGRFFNGTFTIGSEVAVDNISGTFCAVATVVGPPASDPTARVCATFTAPADGLHFAPLTAQLNIIPGQVTSVGNVTIQPGAVSAIVCNTAAPGPIVLSTTVTASAGAGLFGTDCRIGPLSVPVTGELQGPLKGATATLTNGPFVIPALTASPLCPQGLADTANTILNLPTLSTAPHLSIDVIAEAYIPQ